MSQIKLSYVITTYNKLPYLKEVMRLLLLNKKSDEEIVIVDGGSTDGTVEFLDGLFKEGKINQFISEKDEGEAHGYNKTFLLAKGDLIKVITDDDVFYYPAIVECRKYMEENIYIDVLVGNNATSTYPELKYPFLNPEMKLEFEKYSNGTNETFYCNGLPLMIRRRSIPLLGLFNTQYLCVDLEYTIRTGLIANYAFATQFIATRIVNPNSNSDRYSERCKLEQLRLCKEYDYPIPPTWNGENIIVIKPSVWRRLKKSICSKSILFKQPIETTKKELTTKIQKQGITIEEFYNHHYEILEEINKNIQPYFLTKQTN
jgi:glycosyltransferase involved in cell wall biosynthesis